MKKARLTTVLSLTGVLVAGSAAALVNTEVLGNPTPRTAIASEITAGLPEDTAVAVTMDSVVAPPDTEVTASSAVTDDTADDATRTTYRIGDAGTVTVEVADDVLRLVSADAQPGWTVTGTTQVDPLNVEVTIRSLASTVVFRANLLFGKVTTAVEASDNSTSNSTGSSSPGSSNSTPSGNTTPSGNSTPITTSTTPSTGGGQVGGGGGGDPTPVTTGITTHTTTPSTTPTTVDDHGGGGNGGGGDGKGGDDHIDD